MTELLEQHADMQKYIQGIYKNQQLILYWMQDQEARLAQAESALAIQNNNSTQPAEDEGAQDLEQDADVDAEVDADLDVDAEQANDEGNEWEHFKV